MISGIYQSGTGMDSLARMQEVTANNLANVSTNGFKKEMLQVCQAQPARLEVSGQLDLQCGAMQVTEVPTHLALTGEGFFTVALADGMAYTRDGNFALDAQGRLVNAAGHLVQGRQGDIVVGQEDFSISKTGGVIVQGEVIDQIQVAVGQGTMCRLGNGLMTWEDTDSIRVLEPAQVQILQGALEASNVNVIESMMNLMTIVRMYEANQKALDSQDETLKQAVSQVGKSA